MGEEFNEAQLKFLEHLDKENNLLLSKVNKAVEQALSANGFDPTFLDAETLSLLNSSFIACRAYLPITQESPQNDAFNSKYLIHESWKAEALKDDFISSDLKEIIRNLPRKKVIRRGNLTTELARAFKKTVSHLTARKRLKKKDALPLILEMLKATFHDSMDVQGISEDTFTKALQRIDKEKQKTKKETD